MRERVHNSFKVKESAKTKTKSEKIMKTFILTFDFNRTLTQGWEIQANNINEAINIAFEDSMVNGVAEIFNGEVVDSYKLSA